jgi:copper(I)-binding protein
LIPKNQINRKGNIVRIQSLIAAMTLIAAPAFAHDGVNIDKAYARISGGIGGSAAVFFEVQNHADAPERLIGVASDAAAKVSLHTNSETADGVVQMNAVPDGFAIDPLMTRSLKRGGDHIMIMGLKQALKDGDMIHLTLTFAHAGVVEIDVAVDNKRKPEAANMDMGAMEMGDMDMSKMPAMPDEKAPSN